jgi:hypothetical protein
MKIPRRFPRKSFALSVPVISATMPIGGTGIIHFRTAQLTPLADNWREPASNNTWILSAEVIPKSSDTFEMHATAPLCFVELCCFSKKETGCPVREAAYACCDVANSDQALPLIGNSQYDKRSICCKAT